MAPAVTYDNEIYRQLPRLEIKVQAVETSASRNGAANFSPFGKVRCIVGHDDMRIEWVPTLLTIPMGIIQP